LILTISFFILITRRKSSNCIKNVQLSILFLLLCHFFTINIVLKYFNIDSKNSDILHQNRDFHENDQLSIINKQLPSVAMNDSSLKVTKIKNIRKWHIKWHDCNFFGKYSHKATPLKSQWPWHMLSPCLQCETKKSNLKQWIVDILNSLVIKAENSWYRKVYIQCYVLESINLKYFLLYT